MMIEFFNKAEEIEVNLFGDIGDDWFSEDGITIDKVKNILEENKGKPLTFNIQSLGGLVFDALLMHDMIKMHDAPTKARILGATASAGTIVGIAANTVEISENALFLIHPVWGMSVGNAAQLRYDAEQMDAIDARLVNIYQAASSKRKRNKKKSQIMGLMEQEKWISPDDAVEWGFVDAVFKTNKLAAMVEIDDRLPQLPESFLNKISEKMGLFNKKAVVNTVKSSDGSKTFVFEGEELREGTVLNLAGSKDSFEGEHEIEGNRKIIVDAENKVTSIAPVEEKHEPEFVNKADMNDFKNEILNAVKEGLAPVFEQMADIEEKFASIRKTGSNGAPPRTAGVNNSGEEVTASVLDTIKEARKAGQQKHLANKLKKQ